MTQFKKTLATAGVCAALFVSAQANAATSAIMTVKGNIVPAACSINLSNNGEVSFGSIAASTIRNAPAGNTLAQLGTKDMTVTISCEASAAMGFKVTDNRASSKVDLSTTTFADPAFPGDYATDNPSFGFGLGLASNSAKIGAYGIALKASEATADGKSVDMAISDDNGKTWRTSALVHPLSTGQRVISVANPGGAAPKLFTEAVLPMKINAAVQTSSVLGSDEIVLDGNATVSLVYL